MLKMERIAQSSATIASSKTIMAFLELFTHKLTIFLCKTKICVERVKSAQSIFLSKVFVKLPIEIFFFSYFQLIFSQFYHKNPDNSPANGEIDSKQLYLNQIIVHSVAKKGKLGNIIIRIF